MWQQHFSNTNYQLEKEQKEITRLREALEPLATAYEEFMRANDCTEYEIANDPYLFAARAARAALREGGKND